jgi:hypothetical protein
MKKISGIYLCNKDQIAAILYKDWIWKN